MRDDTVPEQDLVHSLLGSIRSIIIRVKSRSGLYCGLNNVDISVLTLTYSLTGVPCSGDGSDGSDTPDISIFLTISR